jgi:hypothetical protein
MKNKPKNNNLNESAGIQVARLFYRQIEIISADVIKDDNVCENLKQKVFEESMKNFDDLPPEEQESYVIAANAAWCAGMSILRTLLELQEDKNENKK